MKPISGICFAAVLGLAISGCQQKSAAPATGAGGHALPVQTVAVTLAPVAQSSEYVASILSRRSATIQPQVSGHITAILVRSGDRVTAGQVMMEIDSQPQVAQVQAQRATENQKKAVYDYNVVEQERQKKLFDAGVTSRDAWDQAQQAYANSKADYESAVSLTKTQEAQLAFYTIRAPYDGVVGDVPVHVGDNATTTTMLTTVDEHKDLEAYIYVPTERLGDVRLGLPVELYDTGGKLLEKTRIDFVSPQVDSTLQGVLIKAPVHLPPDLVRTAQVIKARVIWSTKPMAVVPVLAVTRQGGQSFVFVAHQQNGQYIATQTPVVLGDTVENEYSISSGLHEGDKVIVSSTQFLVNGMPVQPLGA
ncbi:MAG: efflux RND transporter periplasmic adaptor subunit [Terracidiphilus sp.]